MVSEVDGLPEWELVFRFTSGRLCLAFCATVGERWRRSFERLRTPADLTRWLVEAGLADAPVEVVTSVMPEPETSTRAADPVASSWACRWSRRPCAPGSAPDRSRWIVGPPSTCTSSTVPGSTPAAGSAPVAVAPPARSEMTTVWRPARSQRPALISEATSWRVRPAARSSLRCAMPS